MNKRFMMALGGALFFGLMAILVADSYLRQSIEKKQKNNETQIVFSQGEIRPGTVIEDAMLRMDVMQNSMLPPGHYVKKDQILGRVAAHYIPAKTPITSQQTVEKNQGGLSPQIQPGFRGMSVPVNESSSVGGFITPGSFVDIIAILQNGQRQYSRTILQNIRVLAAGDRLQVGADGNQNTRQLINTVTLEVSPQDAEELTLAQRQGQLQLVLRNQMDKGTPITSPVYSAGAPPPSAPGPQAASGAAAPPPMAKEPPRVIIPTPTVATAATPVAVAPKEKEKDVVTIFKGTKREEYAFPKPADTTVAKSN
ncbi:MAG: Flp pilus assembly protein CpaB [Blastocatellia bacterium]